MPRESNLMPRCTLEKVSTRVHCRSTADDRFLTKSTPMSRQRAWFSSAVGLRYLIPIVSDLPWLLSLVTAPTSSTVAPVWFGHSDHTVGLPDLLLTPWPMGRDVPLEVWGPQGLEEMARHVAAAWTRDREVRRAGRQPATAEGGRIVAHDVEPGEVYRDERVVVTAFAVRHGDWDHAFGYRFDTADRRIVISGDTVPVEAVVEACDGCDVLVHEVYSAAGLARRNAGWRACHEGAHTSAIDLGRLAARARPGLLVLYHQLYFGVTDEDLLREVRLGFTGRVVSGRDLDVY